MVGVDLRFDPFAFEFRPKNLLGEKRTVEYFPAIRAVGFYLGESPQRLNSQPVKIVCGGDTLGEVGRLVTPGPNNFRVDYAVNNAASVGFVETHVTRIGQIAFIDYRGLGNNLNSSHRSDTRKNLQRSIRAEVYAKMQSLNVGLTGSPDFRVMGGIFARENRLRRVAHAVETLDAVTLRFLIDSLTANDSELRAAIIAATENSHGSVYFDASGTWSPPAGVRYITVFLWGGGGGCYYYHSGSGTGVSAGRGGNCVRAIIDLGSSPAPSYTITIGAGGPVAELSSPPGNPADYNGGNTSAFGAVAAGGVRGNQAAAANTNPGALFYVSYNGGSGETGSLPGDAGGLANGGGGAGIFANGVAGAVGAAGGAGGGGKGATSSGTGLAPGIHSGGGGGVALPSSGNLFGGKRGGVMITW